MSKPPPIITINQTDPLQQALDNLVAKGLVEIIGTRNGQPVYRATVYSEGKNASTGKPSAASLAHSRARLRQH